MKFYIETIGCQMNVNDSDKMAEILSEKGCVRIQDMTQADLVIINTCSVRFSAEHKAYSLLGRLKEQKDIEIEYSGSTCCMVIQMCQKIICANVGDSRAILLSEIIREDIISLSIDHKPESKNELERIKKYGGVVEKCLYEEGVRDGPYRVWNSSKQEYPGLAVSRSIGDLQASKLGVIPNPDFILKTLKNNMKYIVIASDGIWEFFSNKNVCDIVKNYYVLGDAEGATKELIEKGKKKWAEEGDNADDISVITIFF